MSNDNLNLHNELHASTLEENSISTEETESSLLEIDGTIVFIAVSFIIFTILMQKVFYAPIAQIKKKRSEYLKGIKEEGENALSESFRLATEYLEKIKTAKKKNTANTAQSMAEANEEKANILEEKKQILSEFIDAKRNEIQQEKENALQNIKENISGYAFEISKKILEEEIPIAGVSQQAIDKAINRKS